MEWCSDPSSLRLHNIHTRETTGYFYVISHVKRVVIRIIFIFELFTRSVPTPKLACMVVSSGAQKVS